MQEPTQHTTKPFYKKWRTWVIAWIVLSIIFVIAISSSGEKTDNVQQDSPKTEAKSFNQLANERFQEIKQSAPELDSIECENNNCDTSSVYLNFNSMSEDLEMMVRGNTATYSKFRMDNNKGSNVGVYARYQGKIVFQCEGSKGAVKECK